MSAPRSLTLHTHAKVNLFLRVWGRRPDGYHEISTVMQSVSLHDDLEVAASHQGRMELTSESWIDASVLIEDNLVSEAARLLEPMAPSPFPVRVSLYKRIPIGAGLGGGSANAAGTLVALNRLWDAGLDPGRLEEVGAELGSDVPFCLRGGTALATGRGQQLESVPGPRRLWLVLGMACKALSTADVYSAWRRRRRASLPKPEPLMAALGRDAAAVGELIHNDLEVPAFRLRPELEAAKEALLRAGALGAALAGSGPTLFGVAADEAHAQRVAASVADAFARVAVVSSVPACVEVARVQGCRAAADG